MRTRTTYINLLLISIVIAVSALGTSAVAQQAHSSAEKAPEPKRLEGHIDLLQSAFESAGIKRDRKDFPAVITRVSDGSAAAAANVSEKDNLLSAHLDNNQLILQLERNGKQYTAKIDLSAEGLVKESAALGGTNSSSTAQHSSLHSNEPLVCYGAVGLFYEETVVSWREDRRIPGCWTDRAAQEIMVWEKEYHYQGNDGPLEEDWGKRIQSGSKFLTQCIDKYWPRDLICYYNYHASFDRAGHLVEVCPDQGNVMFGDRKACDRYAYPIIKLLGQSGLLACPPQSRITNFHASLIFGHYHNLLGHY
jgi:hypothetical protein